MEVLTPWGRHDVPAAHAPHFNIGVEPYVRWWAAIWREVTCLVDPTTVLVVTDSNSADQPADRGTPRPEDTGYRTFLRAFNLRDLVDLHPVPQDTYSCFQGAARSRIDTVACHSEAQFTIAPYHYWASTLLLDHHVPLLFTVAFPVIRLGKPSPHTVSRTPEYRLGPVALSPAKTANFQCSVLRMRAVDPPAHPESLAKGPATGHLRLAPRHGQGPGPPLPTIPPSDAPGGASSPLAGSPTALPGVPHAPLGGALYSDGPEHIGHVSDGGAHPQKEPSGLGRGPAPAEPPGGQVQGPSTQARDP